MNKAELVEEVVNQTGLTRRESGDPCRTRTKSVVCPLVRHIKKYVSKEAFRFMAGTCVEIVSRTASSYLMGRDNLKTAKVDSG
ncbi:hypothetical protein KAS10_03755 [Candidatus Aerophobetes bacterium]|jgi:hypothetical protein|nr:hypothetical protein [Candidatus Aerophobetes bacterium]